MRRVPLRFCVLSALLLTLNLAAWVWVRQEWRGDATVAAADVPLKIVSALPASKADTTDRLSLVFNAPVIPPEKLNQPLDAPPFQIQPNVAGFWQWSEPQRLDFVLDQPLPAGQTFKLKPVPELELQTGRVVQVAAELEFQTRPLVLDACQLQSSDREHVTMELKFNQRVEPAALLRHLVVRAVRGEIASEGGDQATADDTNTTTTAGGQDQAPRLETTCLVQQPAEKLVVRCRRVPGLTGVRLELDGKLTGHQGEKPLGAPVARKLDVTPLFTALRAEVEEPELDEAVRVDVCFSADLDRLQAVPEVTVQPAVPELTRRIRQRWYSDSSVLMLEGKFEPGKSYTVTLAPTLRSDRGDMLGTAQTVSFDIPDRNPTVRFPSGSGLLSSQGNLLVELQTVNVAGVKLSASRVHANNLVAHLQGQYSRATSRPIAERTIKLTQPRNVPLTQAVDLRKLLETPAGIYRIEASATDHTWTSGDTIVTFTDLALSVKQERDGLVVWVTSLRTAQPVPGVKLTALSYNNQTLTTAVSGADGTARLPVDAQHPDGKPWVLVGERDQELAYLQVDRRAWVPDDVDQAGRDAPTTYDVLLYAERGVYRPGDAIHLTGLIRDVSGAVPPPFPLTISVKRPDGRTVADLPVTPDPAGQGMFHVEYATREDGQTGPYRFAATLPGAKQTLGQTHVLVEAFVPVRMEVRADPSQARFGAHDKPRIDVHARYLFGQPAAELPVTLSGSFQRIAFVPDVGKIAVAAAAAAAGNATNEQDPSRTSTASSASLGYTFGDLTQPGRVEIPERQQMLDAAGAVQFELKKPAVGGPGLWRGTVIATVTEPGGRSVSKATTVLIDTAERHVGLRLPGRVVPVDAPVALEWIQRTGLDEPATPGGLEFTVVRVEYDTVLRRVRGDLIWKSEERLIPVWSGNVTAEEIAKAGLPGCAGSVEIRCPSAGAYRARVIDQISGSATQIEFYAARDGNSAVASQRPEQLELVLDRAQYVPGSTAKLLINSPFRGTLWVCLETQRVVEQRVLPLTETSTTIELPIPADLRGGAFITATVVRPVDPANPSWLPHRARGMVRVMTDHTDRQLPVTLQAPSQLQPGESVTVTIETTPPAAGSTAPAVVHFWAVDEGILLTSAYKTPDPARHFFAPRKSQIITSDIFADLLPDHQRAASMERIGGDGGGSNLVDALRRSPVPTQRRAAAVVWRTAVPVDSQGRATFTFELPQLIGELRLMAVAVDGDRYGSAQHALTLTTPLLVEASVPRFAAPGDRFQVPVKVFNTTTEPLNVALAVPTHGPLTLAPLTAEQSSLVVKPAEPVTIWLTATATHMGEGYLSIQATATSSSGGMLNGSSRHMIPVRPAGPLHTVTQMVRTKAGEPLTITVPAEFLPGTARTTIAIGGQPSVQLQPAADQLLDYPYGCLEQVSSRLLALLTAREQLALQGDASGKPRVVQQMIDAGIARLWSMQTRNGGLGYWPGSPDASVWGTAYAAGVLAEATRRGHAVDERFTNELAAYLTTALHNSDEVGDENVRAQLCRILAVFQQPQEGWMARLSEQLPRLDRGGRADLAAAWLLLGRKDRALAVLPDDTISQASETSTRGRLTSSIRQDAQLLDVLLDLDRQHPWIPTLVQRIDAGRQQGVWGSTLENASALAVLTRYQSQLEPAEFEGQLDAAQLGMFPFTSAAPARFTLDELNAPAIVNSTGTGHIYLSIATTGLMRDPQQAVYDRQLQVRRRWTDKQGRAVDPLTLRVGDLVQVTVTLAAPAARGESIHNVAVVDALPGGFEIENPRLDTSAGAGETDGSAADRVEFLDDRVVLFASAGRRVQTFRYALRVVSAGAFVLPPIQASCMYDAGYASVHGGGRVEIRP